MKILRIYAAPLIKFEPCEFMGKPGYRRVTAMTDILLKTTDGERRVTIGAGYCCNGFSIPRWLRWVAGGPWQKGWEAAVFHDFMRETAQRLPVNAWWDEKLSDAVFLELLKRIKVSWWKRRIFYRAVAAERWLRRRK